METGSGSTLLTCDDFIDKAVGKYPTVEIQLGGVKLRCLRASGSDVITINDSFMQPKGQKFVNRDGCLRLRAANGLEITYVGYAGLHMNICGEVLPRLGVLIVKDSTDPEFQQGKQVTPGILEIFAIRKCK